LGIAMLRIPLLPDEIDPSQDALVLAAGEVAASGGNQLSRFPALLQAYPEAPYLHFAYGLALAKAGLAAQAVVAFQDETRISAESPLPWIELSRPDLNAPHSALPAAEKAVALAPASGEAHEALAKVLEALGKADQAAAESKLSGGWETGC